MSDKPEQLYSDEITLLGDQAHADYVRLNLRKIRDHRQQFDKPVIGIAGSEGKSTTNRMLHAILSPEKKILTTPPNCSTTTGVTSTLLKMDETHDLAIIELGIVNPDQFQMAVEVAQPNIAVITNIGEAHLASQGDKYIIADAKVALMRNLPETGIAILNIDDDLVSGMGKFSPSRRVIKFGLNNNAHFFANKIHFMGPEGIAFHVNGFYRFHLPIYSTTAIYNALTAISAARILGVEFEEIRKNLESGFALPQHRGNLIKKDEIHILDYSYDATINAVTKACESLAQFRDHASKLILVVGDITNPGPDAEGRHNKIGFFIAALPIDTVITVGKHARHIARGIQRFNQNRVIVESIDDPGQLAPLLARHLEPQSVVLITGSKDLRLSDRIAEIG